jgi:hypothetical protein
MTARTKGLWVANLFFVGLIVLVGAPTLAYHWWDEAGDRARLREMHERDEWVWGRVTAVEEDSDRKIETIRFAYVVDGEEYKGSERKWQGLKPTKVGDPVRVLYHPDRPKIHRTRAVPEEELTFSWWRLLGNAAPGLAPFLVGTVIAWAYVLYNRGRG